MKILMIDDDPEDRDILFFSMEAIEKSKALYFAEDGEQALEMLDKDFIGNNIPGLIILDINMPRLGGTDTLRGIKGDARFRNIPVIIYSTSINPFEKEQCLELGAHSFLTKPTSYQESVDNAMLFSRFLSM
ncbi:response regulator [Chitinophaga arvensicola]|uniref:Response regulator receiver domain-containing protein n=1 Tax=Chitinophaga arvensicola TaxID=29529 RepID=A0A1I0R884_9BACT|nr:response regulator [Chitinophaga arvensicola]SEW36949.1 Response regulator receiver domain-containing protein [Chitinophaga arvensicola]